MTAVAGVVECDESALGLIVVGKVGACVVAVDGGGGVVLLSQELGQHLCALTLTTSGCDLRCQCGADVDLVGIGAGVERHAVEVAHDVRIGLDQTTHVGGTH
ncbi:Uncharacterised protein [Mycobacteroides abscessus subsp. abscessus]|nr:Uncharacterised protein [Mycobacteroides abscessus subsp. abscessus]